MNEMECGHWLDYEFWLEREKEHKIEKSLQELEILSLRNKLETIKGALEGVGSGRRGLTSYAQQQAEAMRPATPYLGGYPHYAFGRFI